MNNKKLIKFTMALTIILSLAACSKDDSEKTKTTSDEIIHYGVDAKTDYYESLDDVEADATLIVRGVRLEKEEAVIEKSGDAVLSAYTFSEFEITNIYINSGTQISEGDVITILENEVYDKDANVVYHIAGYNMMVEGNEYILFLKENKLEGKIYYVSIGVNYGTVSLEDDDRTTVYNTRDGSAPVSFKAYENIWENARKKYK